MKDYYNSDSYLENVKESLRDEISNIDEKLFALDEERADLESERKNTGDIDFEIDELKEKREALENEANEIESTLARREQAFLNGHYGYGKQ